MTDQPLKVGRIEQLTTTANTAFAGNIGTLVAPDSAELIKQLRAQLTAQAAQLKTLEHERDEARLMLVGEDRLANERMLALAACEHDYVQRLVAQAAQLETVRQENEDLKKELLARVAPSVPCVVPIGSTAEKSPGEVTPAERPDDECYGW